MIDPVLIVNTAIGGMLAILLVGVILFFIVKIAELMDRNG